MSACALDVTLAGAATASPSLPLSSSSSRSAVFLPIPGTLMSRPLSCNETARASSSTDRPDRIDSAVRGPTPEILTSSRNVDRSSWLRKPNSTRLANLAGSLDEHLRTIAAAFDVKIQRRNESFRVEGAKGHAERAVNLLQQLYGRAARPIGAEEIELAILEAMNEDAGRDS